MAKGTKHYQLYRSLWDDMLNMACAYHKIKKPPKRQADEFSLIRPLCEMNPGFHASLDHAILAEERYWRTHSGLVLFPEDTDMLELLSRAQFDIDIADALTLPATSFMLAMPKGVTIQGIEAPGCLVTWLPINQYNETIFYPLDNLLGYDFNRTTPKDLENTAQMSLSICFVDPTSRAALGHGQVGYARNRFFIPSEKIPRLLKAKTNEEFYAITGNYSDGDMPWVSDAEDHDIAMERYYMQLVMALSVYYTATERECVRPGLPNGNIQMKDRPNIRIRGAQLLHRAGRRPSQAQVRRARQAARREHLRTWHFRQLRHPRFYQGKYAEWPHGSRIVFVSEAMIGGKGR